MIFAGISRKLLRVEAVSPFRVVLRTREPEHGLLPPWMNELADSFPG